MNAEQATAIVQLLTGTIESEGTATRKVLAAVPNGNRDFKPDPKSRSAWELAVHLAISEVWFADSILQGKFEWTGEPPTPPEMSDPAAVAKWHQTHLTDRLARLRAMPPEQMLRNVECFGMKGGGGGEKGWGEGEFGGRRLPLCPDRDPQREADPHTDPGERQHAVHEVRVDNVGEARDEMRPAVRLPGVRHQHEPHTAGDEREKEGCGIEHQRIVSSAPSTISETPSPSRQFIGSCVRGHPSNPARRRR